MVFNSFSFIIFLPIVFGVYWIFPAKHRWVPLFFASYYFYMSWNVKYVVLILFTTGASYACGLLTSRASSKRTKKAWLIITLVLCLGVLAVFKYLDFALDTATRVMSLFAIQLHPTTAALLLPVGISFYTFQTLSYVIDVYRGNIPAEKHFGKYATFIAFFPQLVAGPIERANHLLPQIKEEHKFDYDLAMSGVRQMIWGFFKKMVIADNLAVFADKIFDDVYNYHGLVLVVAALFFTIQIYCDFSGYSDIAIGTAKLFGINIIKNFDSPYFSRTLREFWKRWHISLSQWFRDYLYIPLGGNRKRPKINLMITFLVSGLWHGASWHFVIWGGIHGIIQVIEKLLHLDKLKSSNRAVIVFRTLFIFAIVSLAWVFFRTGVKESVYMIGHMLNGIGDPVRYIIDGYHALGMPKVQCIETVIWLVILALFDYFSLNHNVLDKIGEKNVAINDALAYSFVAIVLLFSPVDPDSVFIYFQF